MAPSFRMVVVAAVLMFALMVAIVSSVSLEPYSNDRPRTVDAARPLAPQL